MCMDSGVRDRIVYTRRPRKQKSASSSGPQTDSNAIVSDVAVLVAPKHQSPNQEHQLCPEDDSIHLEKPDDDESTKPQSPIIEIDDDNDEVENLKTPSPLDNAKKTPAPTTSPSEGEFLQTEASTNNNENVKRLVETRIDDDKVLFKLFKETPKNDIERLRTRLESELHDVRVLAQRLVEEANKLHQVASYDTATAPVTNGNIDMAYVSADGRNNVNVRPTPVMDVNNDMVYGSGYSSNNVQPRHGREDFIDNGVLMRVDSAVRHQESRPMGLSRMNSDIGAVRNLEPVPYHRQLSVAVTGNNYRDSEKRTPKANQYYPNSEFLLGKDRLPPESNKRTKLNNGRKHHSRHGFGSFSKSCSALLQRLMKHKFGWLFNTPVDSKAMGCADYHIIIQYPMDLGTIKSRLSQNRYPSPLEFAEDVRLVFRNAMTYNPKGHDVHAMAEELSRIFEERWGAIEMEYNSYLNGTQMLYHDMPTPTVPVQSHFPRTTAVLPVARTELTTPSMVVEPRIQRPHVVRAPVPKKPKARDLNKRDMTYDEKQKLSSNLQGLPSEKLDAIVQIIKRRNTALSQHDDEIEVDIDNVDAETLWELDRFVTNYKKSLSKYKRKAELARQAGPVANGTVAPMNNGPAVTAAMQLEKPAFGESGEQHPSVDGQKQQNNDSRSSSSSSSSSDSGSSSDSDSDSSSADGSSHSPKT